MKFIRHVESIVYENLKVLGRIHNFEQLLEAYQLAREAGFTNINLDLMSSLPSQTKEEWEEELQKTVELNPEHISAYQLIIEEGTPFYEKYDAHPELLPDEEESRAIYQTTKRILEANGYMQYEISNRKNVNIICVTGSGESILESGLDQPL